MDYTNITVILNAQNHFNSPVMVNIMGKLSADNS